MEGYLGEEIIEISQSEFAGYTPSDWAMHFIETYGQIDGDHHRLWVLDQVARILKGTEIIIKKASWKNGQYEYRISTSDETTKEYKYWVGEMRGEDEEEYFYDEGIAP